MYQSYKPKYISLTTWTDCGVISEINVDQKNITRIDLNLEQNKVDEIVEVIRLESHHWDVLIEHVFLDYKQKLCTVNEVNG